jgi:hypothetical protein
MVYTVRNAVKCTARQQQENAMKLKLENLKYQKV